MQVNEYHANQLNKYAKFFRQKRMTQIGEFSHLFNDAVDSRCRNDEGNLMTTDEVEDILRSLEKASCGIFEDDLRRTTNMSILAIQQLFQDADAQDIELEMDTSKIEDNHLLEEVDKLGLKNCMNDKDCKKKTEKNKETDKTNSQNKQYENQIKEMKKKIEHLQDELDQNKQKESNLYCEIEYLKANGIESKSMEQSNNLQTELDKERNSMILLRAELEDAKEMLLERGIDFNDFQKRLKSSKQFLQLRKLLTQKTNQLTDLRRQMLKYEPDYIEEKNN